MQKTLMEMLIEAGYPKEEMDHHDSDLYVYVTPLTTKVIEEWCKAHDYRMAWHCPTFRDQITGKMMYDCAFQWYENQQEIVISKGGYMWLFEAKYINMDSDEEFIRKIEFDGDNFFNTEKECYLYAMEKALEMKQKNECLCSLEFVAC